MIEDLTGRVAVVTGRAGGIGRATGERFACELWIMAPGEPIDARTKARAASMLGRTNPTYLREVPG